MSLFFVNQIQSNAFRGRKNVRKTSVIKLFVRFVASASPRLAIQAELVNSPSQKILFVGTKIQIIAFFFEDGVLSDFQTMVFLL